MKEHPGIVKSNSIEPNRTLNFVWVQFPNQSNLIEQMEPNWTQSIRFFFLVSSVSELTQELIEFSGTSRSSSVCKFKAAFLVAFYYAFEAYNPQRYTPGSSNSSFQDLVMDFPPLFYTNHEFENWMFVWVRLIFFSFQWVRFRSIAELNRTQSMNWVRLGTIEI